jgi:hypothetical protein
MTYDDFELCWVVEPHHRGALVLPELVDDRDSCRDV